MTFDQLLAKARTLDTKTVTDNGMKFGKNMAYPLLAVVAFHVFEGDLGLDVIAQPIEWLLDLLKGSDD